MSGDNLMQKKNSNIESCPVLNCNNSQISRKYFGSVINTESQHLHLDDMAKSQEMGSTNSKDNSLTVEATRNKEKWALITLRIFIASMDDIEHWILIKFDHNSIWDSPSYVSSCFNWHWIKYLYVFSHMSWFFKS